MILSVISHTSPSILKVSKMGEITELDRAAAEDFLDRRQSEVDTDERDPAGDTSLMEDVGCCGCLVVCLLILSPPVVLIGVILLSTGAILGEASIFGCGLAVIVGGVIMGAVSAFIFVRMRSKPVPISPSRSARRRHSKGTQPQSSARAIEPMESQTIELTFCNSEMPTGLFDQEYRIDSSNPDTTDHRNTLHLSNSIGHTERNSEDATRTPILTGFTIA